MRFSQFIKEQSLTIDPVYSLKRVKAVGHVRFDIMQNEKKVGVITLNKHDGFHSIKVINLDNSVRGQNLGSKVIDTLSKVLGKITSSLDGQTSDAALSMWSKVHDARQEKYDNPKGFIFVKD